jgi:hypothetical protein
LLSRTSFAILPLLIPLCTRKSTSYLSQFCIVFHHLALISHLLFKFFLAALFCFLNQNHYDPPSVSQCHLDISLLLFFFQRSHFRPGFISLLPHKYILSLLFLLSSIFHHFYAPILDFCLPHLSASSPITFTH